MAKDYSTFENEIELNGERFTENEVEVSDRKKVIVLGSGPNRIGQGIEFDYCCVHGVLAAKEMGYETIMINELNDLPTIVNALHDA